VNDLQPSSLSEFVGQRNATELLRWEIQARKSNNVKGHFLCVSQPGLGKTALGVVACLELDLPLVHSVGRQFENAKELWAFCSRLARIQEPFFWIIDEIESLPASQILHLILEENAFESAEGKRIQMPQVTVWGTSNFLHRIPEALLSRMRCLLQLSPYDESDLKEIVIRSAYQLGMRGITHQAAEEISAYSNGSARNANAILQTATTYCRANGLDVVNVEAVWAVLDRLELHPGGVDAVGLRVLKLLAAAPKGRLGLVSLAFSLSIHPRDLQERSEVALLRNGLVAVSGTGRTILPRGLKYLESLETI
jgi:Holliday junction DNA helicase RuvB